MNIDPEKFTELGISAIREMSEVAKRNGQQEVEVWHLLSALMAQENGIVPALLEEMGIGTAPIQLALQRELKNLPKIAGDVNTARSYASAPLTEAVEKGQQISQDMQDDYISTEHLLLGLAAVGKPATFKQFLKNFELSEKKIKETLTNWGQLCSLANHHMGSTPPFTPVRRLISCQETEADESTLSMFSKPKSGGGCCGSC